MKKASHPKVESLVQLLRAIVGDTRGNVWLPPKHLFWDILQELMLKSQSHLSDFSGHYASQGILETTRQNKHLDPWECSPLGAKCCLYLSVCRSLQVQGCTQKGSIKRKPWIAGTGKIKTSIIKQKTKPKLQNKPTGAIFFQTTTIADFY